MKRKTILLCTFVCLSLLSACTNDKDKTKQNSVSEQSGDINFEVVLPDQDDVPFVEFVPDEDITYDFKDPENADGIVVVPKE